MYMRESVCIYVYTHTQIDPKHAQSPVARACFIIVCVCVCVYTYTDRPETRIIPSRASLDLADVGLQQE
jgi:hypothetical protein